MKEKLICSRWDVNNQLLVRMNHRKQCKANHLIAGTVLLPVFETDIAWNQDILRHYRPWDWSIGEGYINGYCTGNGSFWEFRKYCIAAMKTGDLIVGDHVLEEEM